MTCDQMVTYCPGMDEVFKALADPTRRALLDELFREDGQTLSALEAHFAMSRFDHAVGHVRRYTRAGLHRVLESAGLLVEEVRYVNVPGLLAWWVGMRLLRMTPGDGPLLRVWDRVVVPLTRSLEECFGAPFGQSVFAVARVPGA